MKLLKKGAKLVMSASCGITGAALLSLAPGVPQIWLISTGLGVTAFNLGKSALKKEETEHEVYD